MHKFILLILLLFLASCTTTSLIPAAIAKGEKIGITVQEIKGEFTKIYQVTIQKYGEEYELIHSEGTNATTYKLPTNKVELLSEMEVSLKDLDKIKSKYYLLTITTDKQKKSYKINTDIIHDLISGLKKK